MYRHCYSGACPDNHPYHAANEFECKTCSTAFPNQNTNSWDGTACVENCGERPYKNDSGQIVCMDACTEKKFDFRQDN